MKARSKSEARGGLAAEVAEMNREASAATETKPKTKKKRTAKPAGANGTKGPSFKGRSSMIGKLVKAGEKTDKQIFEDVKEKYPGSSEFNVLKTIRSKKHALAKAEKAAKEKSEKKEEAVAA
jgi:hypothetical protein